MKRREFLKHSGSLTVGSMATLMASPWLRFTSAQASAQEWVPRFFVLIRAQYGWDTTLSLEPLTHKASGTTQNDVFLEYSPEQIFVSNNLRLGPAVAPMKDYFSQLSVINGVHVSPTEIGHEVAREYMSSGALSGNILNLPLEINLQRARTPYGVVQYHTSLATKGKAVRLTSISDLLSQGSISIDAVSKLVVPKKGSELQGSVATFMQDEGRIRAYRAAIAQAHLDAANADSMPVAGQTAALAFKYGVAEQMQVDTGQLLDTHSGHEKVHLAAQTSMWSDVKSFIDSFKAVEMRDGRSVFDFTTFMVTSEFSRTPALNGQKGKDHNPRTNSVLLLGRGIRPGVQVGSSRVITSAQNHGGVPDCRSMAMNAKTGEVAQTLNQALSTDFHLITPSHVANTVFQIMGFDGRLVDSREFDVPPVLPVIA
jgi:uncharacterized protein (DUF1501 family)